METDGQSMDLAWRDFIARLLTQPDECIRHYLRLRHSGALERFHLGAAPLRRPLSRYFTMRRAGLPGRRGGVSAGGVWSA
jgi:hypothetical protein